MKIVQFQSKTVDFPHLGVVIGQKIHDVTSAGLPSTLLDLLLSETNVQEALERALSKGAGAASYSISDVTILAPVTRPDKILCAGFNYRQPLKNEYSKVPEIFCKFGSCIVGDKEAIVKPKISDELAWEVELVVVIGKRAKDVKITEAQHYVLGYTVGQDLTARDWCRPEVNFGQILLGKSMDGFCPLGPWVVTRDEVADPQSLKLRTWVNGVLKQDGSTKDMVHGIDKLISYISSLMTLHPGDLIMTGTPPGIGNQEEYLQPGDLLETEIEGIGKISNTIV